MSRSKSYKKVKGASGIYQNTKTYHYMVEKRIGRKLHSTTFASLFEAKQWYKKFDGTNYLKEDEAKSDYSTLKEVWESMQKNHFPILATTTKEIWLRRYRLLQTLEHLPMDRITPYKITECVMYWVGHFSTEEYQ